MKTAPDFDRIARVYRWAEYAALGTLLQRVRTHFLPQLQTAHRVLALGDGDGRFLEAFLRSNLHAQALAVDASPAMLRLLRRRTAAMSTRISTQTATFATFVPDSDYDLVVTHFALDCLDQEEVNALASRVGPHTAEWLVSDFGYPHGTLQRVAARLYLRTLYLAFRILTGLRTQRLPDHAEALRSAGFCRVARKQWMGGFLFTELWQRDGSMTESIQLS